MDLLAHSPRGEVPAQRYADHINGVRAAAEQKARLATAYYAGDRAAFVEAVAAAATYHDLGKLDEANQEVLRRESRDPLAVAHDDAGPAELLRLGRQEAAVLAAAHHAGLFSEFVESSKQAKAFRNLAVAAHVDALLEDYLSLHGAMGCPRLGPLSSGVLHRCGFTRRIALSCLVDADHGNTAGHYGKEVVEVVPATRWQERLEALDRYVSRLPEGATESERSRNALRRRVYEACRSAEVPPSLRSCDAPVGSGKTTAVMAHLLRAAHVLNLRHIFVVLPYTNIITQAVDVYRRALVMPGEEPDEVVAEHHHQADFESVSLRQLATLWRAPIIVTTAVQFFETLANHRPAQLRKLHELAGSAVFVDETHAAIPSHLWPQVWRWLETWVREWSGHVVFASGTLPRFWQLREFVDPPKSGLEVPDLLPAGLRQELVEAEHQRIRPVRRPGSLDCDRLIDWVRNAKGPRLMILNTVQSAAVVAARMRKVGCDVLHLSTALAPVHRGPIVERIKQRLKDGIEDWTLVATSCVEAGMDLSFRSGFRESSSTASLIQVGGRVSRGGEYGDAELWDFCVNDAMLTRHPGFVIAQRVLSNLFDEGVVDKLAPSELTKEAMRREVTQGAEDRAADLRRAEHDREYPEVTRLGRVIDADTQLVLIDQSLIEIIRRNKPVPLRVLLAYSVQIWTRKIAQLPVAPVFGSARGTRDSPGLYAWQAAYDADFLGYMKGMIPILEGLRDGGFIA